MNINYNEIGRLIRVMGDYFDVQSGNVKAQGIRICLHSDRASYEVQ